MSLDDFAEGLAEASKHLDVDQDIRADLLFYYNDARQKEKWDDVDFWLGALLVELHGECVAERFDRKT